ncbi:hypothetical protein [Pseudomonas sp. TMP9]|uniref:hypothetical protein n=1 Tax=Pseudomonas sp. TMP9 TaxID=3133144 RepID=UPI0030D028B2
MLTAYKIIATDDFAVLRKASRLLACDIVMDEMKKSITWGPLPRLDNSAYIVDKLDYTSSMWECFLEMIEWGAAVICPGGNDEVVIADKEIVDIFIRSIQRLIDALKTSLDLTLRNSLSTQRSHNHPKKHWQQNNGDSYTL